jgi:uroporphyrinogen decarboxylase
MASKDKLLLRTLRGDTAPRPPFWLMRQAGRYLPEYRKLRAETGSFLDLCLTPQAALEVTLQPIRRYGMDAAILFSDILMVPHGLGQHVTFEEGRGPVLDALAGPAALDGLRLDGFHDRVAPVYETVRLLSKTLPAETALIGFAGAPWTVASYMIEGGSSKDFAAAKAWAYGDPESFARLIDLLVEATSEYLLRQVEAGAEVLQLFDSWAGVWAEPALRRWCLAPSREIVRRVGEAAPDVPVIVFPRGAGVMYEAYAAECGAAALGLDTTVPAGWAADRLQPRGAVQGNLDPLVLVAGGAALEHEATRILDTLGHGPFIFNLGHGIVPQTPPEHVARLAELVRGWSRRAPRSKTVA